MTGFDENRYATDFPGARAAFLDACAAAGLAPEAYPHPLQGPAGEALSTDVVRIGPERADRLLVIISGVHGVELYCGSGCQVRMLHEDHFGDLPADTAVLLIHALNPWGAAHSARTTEGNVDLCRNFLDFDAALPQAPAYEKVAHAFAGAAGATGAREILRAFTAKNGVPAFLAAVMGGQYAHPDGFSFGGGKRVWSNRLLTEQLQTHGAGAERVLGIDIHSGLGPYGHGTLVSMQTGAQLAKVRKFFGESVEAPRDRSPDLPGEFYVTTGHCADGFANALPSVDAMMVTAEFGTYSAERNLAALVDSHWLNVHGDAGDKGAAAIRQEMLETHAPDDPAWRDAVWTQLLQTLHQASRCLRED